MKIEKNQRNLFLSSVALVAFFTISEANAGIVKMINHSCNRVEVDVIPEPSSVCSSYCWKCLGGSLDSNNQRTKEIIIPLGAFKENEAFSVVGTEGGFLGNGECRNLSVLKNYEISFFETPFGLRCESKII